MLLPVKAHACSISVMRQTGYVIDERFVEHAGTEGHPERPERMLTLIEWMKSYERDGLVRVEPRAATREELLANHDAAHIDAIAASAGKTVAFDYDTHATPSSYETALLAAGGSLALVDEVMAGNIDNGFAVVRPPGHHAEADRAMGFCFFNNVAVAARMLIDKYGLERVLVVDWDVHHGNGTQRSFYANNDVLFVSTHQWPLYPGTGDLDEVGVSSGAGFTLNVPMAAGQGDDEYAQVFAELITPVAKQFDPQFVLISAGFDHHHLDLLGSMQVTQAGMGAMARSLLHIADEHAGGKCVALLEGGYHLDGLREGVEATFDELGREGGEVPVGSGADAYVEAVRKRHKNFWQF